MSLAIAGKPLGPYQSLSTPVSRYVQPAPSCTVSAPATALAWLIADTSESTLPEVPEHRAMNVLASAGAPPNHAVSALAHMTPTTARAATARVPDSVRE